MSYLAFHLVFILPPILLLAGTLRRPWAGVGGARARWSLPLVALIAFVYTTPWDNYLVYRGVWGYGTERVLATIGYVPVEEYLFFLLQPFLTGLWTYHVLRRRPLPEVLSRHPRARAVGGGALALVSLLGAALLLVGGDRALYLGLILAWAGPVLAGLWIFGADALWERPAALALAVAAPTCYLWLADAIALRLGIWSIADAYSLGLDPLGLPVEEATFFLVTNLLVVSGAYVFLFGDRLAALRSAAGAAS